MAREEDSFENLPAGIVDRLKAAEEAVPVITARVDRAVSEMARAQFAARGRSVHFLRHAGVAVAASVLLAVIVLQWPLREPAREGLYADIDGSGRIDIADVLAAARTRAAGERTRAELDAFAYRVVSLEPDGDPS